MSLTAQPTSIELTFTGSEGQAHRQPDSINVLNLDNHTDTTLYWPDTVLVIAYPVGITEEELPGPALKIKAFPNPFYSRCHLEVSIPRDERVILSAHNILGRKLTVLSMRLPSGVHAFDFIPGNENIFILTIQNGSESKSIKLISCHHEENSPKLVYNGLIHESILPFSLKSKISNFTFSPGEELLCSGFSEGVESVLYDSPDSSRSYIFQFASGIPCPGDSLVSYLGEDYPTVQVFSQCWLRKNLNAGGMIDGMAGMTDNGILEKYCMADDTAFCRIYGGLYQWNEMMQYTATEGAQGICPPGWHIPTDLEWRILEGAADSLYRASEMIWDTLGFRGYDAGFRLRSDSLWKDNMNGGNAVGFNALPSGTRGNVGFFLLLGENAPFWSSSVSTGSYVWYRVLTYNSNKVYRYSFDRFSGFGVRCLRD